MKAAIRVENLSVSFAGKRVIRQLSLEIPSGSPTFLSAARVCGKTTLLRALNRLNECLPGCATSGQVLLQLGGEWIERLRRQNERRESASARRHGLPVAQHAADVDSAQYRDAAQGCARPAGGRSRSACRAGITRSPPLGRGQGSPVAAGLDALRRAATAPLPGGRWPSGRKSCCSTNPPRRSTSRRRSASRICSVRLKSRYTLVVVSHSLSQAQRLAESLFVLHDGGRIPGAGQEVFQDRDALFAVMNRLI